MKLLKQRRMLAKARITRVGTYTTTFTGQETEPELQVRLDSLEENWKEFHDVHLQLLTFEAEGEAVPRPEELDAEMEDYQERYFQTKTKLVVAIAEAQERKGPAIPTKKASDVPSPDLSQYLALLTKQTQLMDKISSSCRPDGTSEHQLPKIQLKSFSGDFREWNSFHDLFVSSVHDNPRLTASQKFHYLKSFLIDEAAALLKHIPVTDPNYKEAWDKLVVRYTKPGRIASAFVNHLLQLSPVTQSTARTLRSFTDQVDEVLRGLRALHDNANDRNIWLIHILLGKLDNATRSQWAEFVSTRSVEREREFPTVEEFVTYLERRCSSLEATYTPVASKPNTRPAGVFSFHGYNANTSCPHCDSAHGLYRCPQFLKMSLSDRVAFVHTHALCINCLRLGHSNTDCQSKFTCQHCQQRHHSLLHHQPANAQPRARESLTSSEVRDSQRGDTHSSGVLVGHHSTPEQLTGTTTVLPTAIAYVYDIHNHPQTCRLLLDSGSQVSFITEGCVQRLGMNREHARIPISGLTAMSAGVTRGQVRLVLHSRFNNETIALHAYILDTITSLIPTRSFTVSNPHQYQSIQLADPKFNVSSVIDILVGADVFFSIFREANGNGPNRLGDAHRTMFGWVIGGTVSQEMGPVSHTATTLIGQVEDVDRTLQRFWELEAIPSPVTLTDEDQRVEDHFASTHTRSRDGRYVVELPFKSTVPVCYGNSLVAAIRRQESMERRFKSNDDLKHQYTKFMTDYLELGHMTEIINPSVSSTECYYLPHHAVFKAGSSTTKLRVVFDGTSKHGISASLNETLAVGPSIQRDLFSICLRFRRHRYAICGDIEKMFRQIWVAETHRDFQRIVWRCDPREPLKHYRLNTVTYGTTSAPFLSVRVLQQLAHDIKTQSPKLAHILLNDFYVDDVMTGAETSSELIALQNNLCSTLRSAGLPLRKWITNCWPLLISIPDDQRELSPLEFTDDSSIKVLGLQWFPSKDVFSYRVAPPNHSTVTKRTILSDASRIFDPLGFLAPAIISIKIMFQQLWLLNLSWDDPVPQDVTSQWKSIQAEVHKFAEFSIPRRIWYEQTELQFHAFCDASEKAFAAVVYCRSVCSEQVRVELVAAKTKVAPLKQVSLPRLELCGAVLLCQLVDQIQHCLQLPSINVYAWTDSTIVLHWLSSVPRRWATFIGNRTSQILTSLPRNRWNHVSSGCNPADCASRGLSPTELMDFQLWWHGPAWLLDPPDCWTTTALPIDDSIPPALLEERQSARVLTVTVNTEAHFLTELVPRVSSWTKLVRVVSWCQQFRNRLCNRLANQDGLTRDTLDEAREFIIRQVQDQSFRTDIHRLEAKQGIPRTSRLVTLSPFLDQRGVLRVGGRLTNSTLPFAAKHPIILPGTHLVAVLIARHYHHKHLHAGVAHLFFLLRQEYWIIGGRNLVRKLVHQCVPCFRQRQSSNQQLMANLPTDRITYARPFSRVGVDYAGPVSLRLFRGRNPRFTKGYIALFVCFVTKAVHLELASDLTTNGFMAALQRFVARRGKPTVIYSDNGTNFVGARRMLSEMHSHLLSESHTDLVRTQLAHDGIQWSHIPPHAPHHGGLWEAGVRSVKLHLRRVIGNHVLTYEEMSTLLARIEAILNSRPICASSDLEIDALTPSHFLIGQPYTTIPEPDISDHVITPLQNWKLLSNLTQGVWKRWHQEYLSTLQQRPKWQNIEVTKTLAPGILVIVKEPRLPPSKWILGRIQHCHPGPDGLIRVATVRTADGSYTRPITKLIPLPTAEETEVFRVGQDV